MVDFHQVEDQVRGQVWVQVRSQVEDRVRGQVWVQVKAQVGVWVARQIKNTQSRYYKW